MSTSVAPVSYGTEIADNTPVPSTNTPYGAEPARNHEDWLAGMKGRPDLTPVIDAIVEAATTKNPKQRYLVAPGTAPFAAVFAEKERFDEGRRAST